LNSNSTTRIDYRPNARIIQLERGEAFFRVAHNAQRPFWVVAGNSWVRAVGTAFNVDLRPSGVQVTVSEGVVKVAGDGVGGGTPSDAALSRAAVSVLTAGEQVDMHGHVAAIRSLKPSELLHSVAWRQGSVNFENQPLGAVIEEVSRYTDLHIEIGDEALRQLPVGGTFGLIRTASRHCLRCCRKGWG